MNKKTYVSLTIGLLLILNIQAQQVSDNTLSTGQDLDLSKEYNVITTAVPFMTIAPDSRSGGMGEAGVATQVDVWSQHWNASKYVLADNDLGVGISYTPWLENLGIKDINLIYVAGYKKLDRQQAIGASLRYFSMGEIPAYDESGNSLQYSLTPKEYAFDVSYSRFLGDNFTMAMTGRFINSNLGVGLDNYKPGRSVAADISATYFNDITISGQAVEMQIGGAITNIGSKINYSANQKDFIPTNLRLGIGLQTDIDQFNAIGVYLDFNKLLVPTPPKRVYAGDDAENNPIYEMEGKDPNVSVPAGIFQSFIDAPGGFREEINEIIANIGAEYWYNKQFAVRAGYFHEAETKGNRKYFTVGAGLRLNVFGLDFAYLIPTQGTNSPLANTFRFSLTFDFEGLAQEQKALTD